MGVHRGIVRAQSYDARRYWAGRYRSPPIYSWHNPNGSPAGFNYQFHALNADRKSTELDGALKKLFLDRGAQPLNRLAAVLRARFPFLRGVLVRYPNS
jgi:hypothetical protein